MNPPLICQVRLWWCLPGDLWYQGSSNAYQVVIIIFTDGQFFFKLGVFDRAVNTHMKLQNHTKK